MMMELPAPSPTTSFLAVVLAAALFLASILRLRGRAARKYNLPPGPRPWPVIGNLDLLGPLPHHSARDLSARHGPLMSLRLGSFPAVVASSPDMARFFLKTRDLAFVDRPRTAAGKYISYNYSGLFSSPYGAYWRQGRKLWQAELFNARRLASLEHVRAEEVRSMLGDLRAAAASSSAGGGRAAAAVALREHLFMVNLNVIDEIFFLHGVLNVGDVIPWLGWLDPQGYVKRMKRLAKMVDRFLEHVLDEHNERRRREGEEFVATDMVDLLLELADDPTLEVPIERHGVKGFVLVRQETTLINKMHCYDPNQ